MGSSMIWSLREWAEAVASLPVEALPLRVVLVPRLRVAHALKRELAAFAPRALLGTTFLTPTLAAREVVTLAGVAASPGEEALRPARVQAFFDAAPALQHFDAGLLASANGWTQAFSRTLGELEAAGVTAHALRGTGKAQLEDLALALEAVSDTDGSLTSAGLLRRATELLAAPATWPWPGHTLVVANGHETGAERAFFAAIPRVQLRVLGHRPLAKRWVHHVEALVPNAGVLTAPPPPTAANELALLQRYLFEDPQVLADPARPRSGGRDDSVELEEHAGVEAELEATAEWVVRQVRAGRPLDRIAVLVPHAEPLVSLVRARLQRVSVGDAPLPVFVAGGEAALHTACGIRLLALLRVLGAFLSSDAMIDLMPLLSVDSERPIGRDDAIGLVASLGTLGGSQGKPEGALEWLPAMARAETQLVERVKALQASLGKGDDAEADTRRLKHLERQAEQLGAARRAMSALDGIVRLVVDEAPLATLWPVLDAALTAEPGLLRLPPDSIAIVHRFRHEVALACADDVGGRARGVEALAVCEEALRRLRQAVGRFGDANVYVGTVRSAPGLGFDAVRFIGLAEGSIPPSLREDAVLPGALRETLGVPALASRELRSLREVHALFRVVHEARAHVTFSYARADLSGSVHEPSSVFIEVAAALGRPNAATGERAAAVPRASELERDAFAPAREVARGARLEQPTGAAAWLDRVAHRPQEVPSDWSTTPALDPRRAEDLRAAPRGDLDGYLGEAAAALPMRGLSAEHPLSASRLKALLQCPYRFLLETVLGWTEAAEPQPTGAIDVLTWGTLVHRVLERFGREVGAKLATLTEPAARQQLEQLAEEEFAALAQRYALLSDQVRAGQRRRLTRTLDRYFDAEWAARRARKLVAVERGFGLEQGLELPVGGGALFVTGYIDRLDTEARALLVRDYKTGKAHPFLGEEKGPSPELDAQLALYSEVARKLADRWETPSTVHAAYAYPSEHDPLRLFGKEEGRAAQLETAGKEWLEVAREVLEQRTFPRRTSEDGCRYCPFGALCGAEGPKRSDGLLAEPKSELEERLVKLWAPPAKEEAPAPAKPAAKPKKPAASKGAKRSGKKGA